MSEEPKAGKIIDMPEQQTPPAGMSILSPDELPEGGKQFYEALGVAFTSAQQALGPFARKHAVFSEILGEVTRYLELSVMYAERGFMYTRHPAVLAKLEESEQEETHGGEKESPDKEAS